MGMKTVDCETKNELNFITEKIQKRVAGFRCRNCTEIWRDQTEAQQYGFTYIPPVFVAETETQNGLASIDKFFNQKTS